MLLHLAVLLLGIALFLNSRRLDDIKHRQEMLQEEIIITMSILTRMEKDKLTLAPTTKNAKMGCFCKENIQDQEGID